jgi:hypothetical protein
MDSLRSLLLILGFTNLGRTLLGEKAPSHLYACGELEYGFEPSPETTEKEKIALIHVPTHDQLADVFTKPLDQETLTRLWGDLVFV